MRTFHLLAAGLVAAGAVMLGPVGAAHATVFGGTSSFKDGSGSSNVSFKELALTNPFATPSLTAGQSYTWNSFATIQGTDTGSSTWFDTNYKDNISLTLTFNQPGSAIDKQSGTGTMTTLSLFGWIYGYSGSISWSGDTHTDCPVLCAHYAQDQVAFADGAVALVDIYDTALSGTGNVRSGDVSVRIVDKQDPIPEPATIATFATALLGLAGMIRLRRQSP